MQLDALFFNSFDNWQILCEVVALGKWRCTDSSASSFTG